MEWQAESAQTDPDAEEDASRMSCRESAMERDLCGLRRGSCDPRYGDLFAWNLVV